jgi:dihydrofolate reductase
MQFAATERLNLMLGEPVMSRLIMWNLLTLDGYFEGAKAWELDWHETVWGPELEALSIQQLKTADRLLFGRVTYEGMAAHWPTAQGEVAELMNRVPKVVFSRTLRKAEWSNATLVNDGAAEKVAALKRQGDGNTFVFGSGNLSTSLINQDLFDEYRLIVTPTLLGSGRPLFAQGNRRMRLKLLEARPLSTGGVILRYEPVAKP